MGRKTSEGAKYPPLEPAPPLTPIGTPVTPNLPRAGGPGPSRPGPMAARGGPPDPTAEEKLPHPIIQSVPKLHKTIRHPGKARLPRLYWTPPPAEAPKHRRPPHQSRAQAHAPTHAPGDTPTRTQAPRPSRNPNPEAERPRSPNPPPGPIPEQCGRQAGNLRPPAQASPAAPHAAARETASKSHQYPIQAKAAAPAPNPQETHPQGTPRCPRPILPPHANNKNHSRTESRPPPTLGDGADQRSPERLI